MKVTRVGLFGQLQDKNTSCKDKVKLVSYVWQTPSIFIPNKEQVLLDWLCTAIISNEKCDAADNKLVWQCFLQVLKCKRTHCPTNTGRSLLVKSALLKTAVNVMTECEQNEDLTDLVMTCCVHLLTSPALSAIFTSQYTLMLQLVTVLIEMAVSRISNDDTIFNSHQNLLTIVTEKFILMQQQSNNSQKVALDAITKLMLPCIRLASLLTNDDGSVELPWRDVLTNTDTVISSTIFHKDLANQFIYYIKLKSDESITDSSPPKIPEHFFHVLYDQESSAIAHQAVFQFLPKVIHKLFHHVRIRDNFTIFNSCRYMLKMLNISLDSTERIDTPPNEEQMKTLYRLLKVCSDLNVYNVAWDSTNGDYQLKFLQKLTGYLLNHFDKMISYSYSCLEVLLQLNHMAVELHMPVLLHKACCQLVNDSECRRRQESFISCLVDTYRKLRQIPKFLKYIFQSVHDFGSQSWSWSSLLLNRISDYFTSLPQGVTIEVWNLFLSEISTIVKEDNYKMALIVPFFSNFLLNVHLLDYNLTAKSLTQVHELMKQTKDRVIIPLMDRNNECLSSLLALLHCWGEMQILLERYCRLTSTPSSGDKANFRLTSALMVSDLSYVHNFITKKEASILFKSVQKSSTPSSRYFLDLLLMQKVRALLVFNCKKDSAVITSVQNVMQYFIKGVNTYLDGACQSSWDKQPESVIEDNYPVALWQLLLLNLPLVAEFCTKDELLIILTVVVKTASYDEQKNDKSILDDMSSISGEFFKSDHLQEMMAIQTCFLSTVLSAMLSISAPGEHLSPKKKKRTSRQNTLWDLMSQLACSETDWCQSTHLSYRYIQKLPNSNDKQWNILQNVAAELSNYLNQESVGGHFTPSQIKKLSKLTKILENTPLEYLLPGNHSRCMLALLVLLFSLDSENEAHTDLLVAVSYCIIVLLDGAESYTLFSLIKSGELLSALLTLSHNLPYQAKSNVDKLVQTLIQIAGRTMSTLMDLKPCIVKMADKLSKLKQSVSLSDAGSRADVDVSFALLFLKCLSKVIQKGHIKDEMRDLCLQYFNALSPFFIHCLDIMSLEKQSTLDMEFASKVLDGYGCILLVHDKVSNIDEAIVQSMRKSCCLSLMMMNYTQCEAVEKRALNFSRAVCKLDHITTDQLPDTFLLHSWTSLVAMLDRCSTFDVIDYSLLNEDYTHANEDRLINCTVDSTARCGDEEVRDEQMDENVRREASIASDVQLTMTSVVSRSTSQDFQQILNSLLSKTVLGDYIRQKKEIKTSLLAWQQLAKTDLTEEQYSVFGLASQDLVSRLQFVVQQGWQRTDTDLSGCVIPVLYTQVQLLSHGPALLSPQSALTCLHSIFHCSHQQLSTKEGAVIFSASYELLNNLLVHHTQTVYSMIPAFTNAAKLLMKVVIEEGDQEKGPSQNVLKSAYLLTRLFTLIGTHKVEFSKVALYIVADYVSLLQKVTLLTDVKLTLRPGIYSLLDLCDQHSLAVLFTVLTSGVKEVFSSLHADYNKFHKHIGTDKSDD